MNTYECLSSTGCGLFMTPWQVSTDWLNVLSSWLIYKLRSDCKPYSMHFEQRFPIQAVTSRAEKFSFFAQVFFFCCVQLIKEHTHSHQCPTVDVINVVATIKISPNQSDECPSNINCNLRFLPIFFFIFCKYFLFYPMCYDRLRPLHCQKRIAEWKRMQILRRGGLEKKKALSPLKYSCGTGRNSNFD